MPFATAFDAGAGITLLSRNGSHLVQAPSASADHARLRRADRRLGARGLARPHRLREPARRRVPRHDPRGQSESSEDPRPQGGADARRDQGEDRPRGDRDPVRHRRAAAQRGGRGGREVRGAADRAAARSRASDAVGARHPRGDAQAPDPPARTGGLRRHPDRHRPQRHHRQRPGAAGAPRAGHPVRGDLLGADRFRHSARDRLFVGAGTRRRTRHRLRRAARLPAARSAHRQHPALSRVAARCPPLPVGAARRGADQADHRPQGGPHRRTRGGPARRRGRAVAGQGVQRGAPARRHRPGRDVYATVRGGAHPVAGAHPARRSARHRHQRPRARADGRGRRRPRRHTARRVHQADLRPAERSAAGGYENPQPARRARHRVAGADRRRGQRRAGRREHRRRRRAARAAARVAVDRHRARRGRGRPRRGQAGSRVVDGRGRPQRGTAGAGGRRGRELLHARECGRRLFVSRRLPAQPGLAARSAAAAAGAPAVGPRRRRACARPRAGRRASRPHRRRGAPAARGVRHSRPR